MIRKLYKYTGSISSFSYRRNSPEAVPVVDMILGDINDDDKAPIRISAAGHLGRAAPNKATRPHAQNQITNQEVHKMAWLYIPAETGERIETICNQHYNPGRGACDCPLWPACSYSNDLTKSSAENTRIFEQGMAAALAALDNENRR